MINSNGSIPFWATVKGLAQEPNRGIFNSSRAWTNNLLILSPVHYPLKYHYLINAYYLPLIIVFRFTDLVLSPSLFIQASKCSALCPGKAHTNVYKVHIRNACLLTLGGNRSAQRKPTRGTEPQRHLRVRFMLMTSFIFICIRYLFRDFTFRICESNFSNSGRARDGPLYVAQVLAARPSQ